MAPESAIRVLIRVARRHSVIGVGLLVSREWRVLAQIEWYRE